VKIKRGELLKALRENLSGHRKIFEEALDGYKRAVIDELERNLQLARDGKRFPSVVRIPEPKDHTKEYESIIRAVEMSVDDEIELEWNQFECYVMDNWSWKHSFLISNASYSGTAKMSLDSI
jgi:hypothetical protein